EKQKPPQIMRRGGAGSVCCRFGSGRVAGLAAVHDGGGAVTGDDQGAGRADAGVLAFIVLVIQSM
ncbi:hypothetical protein, partial [Streptomyces sp. NPDC057496]|uniref:hypothetical protein n=1 Tax=Streptomyces sp. NPDC057496 TaxID=3346149 RepID=UPI0036AFEAB1